MAKEHYAHTREGAPKEEWQPLLKHLENVANMASTHAAAFDSAEWGALAGRWHDLGKYADDFQAYLEQFADDPEVVDASVLDEEASADPRAGGPKTP